MRTDTLEDTVANITIFCKNKLAAAILYFFRVPVVSFVRHLVLLESFKMFENFKPLIRNSSYRAKVTEQKILMYRTAVYTVTLGLVNVTATLHIKNSSE